MMKTVSVIGVGSMGEAIASLAVTAGASVQLLGRDPERTTTVAARTGSTAATVGDALSGEIVVLAVLYPAVSEVVEAYRNELAGRVLVDITNPVDFSTLDGMLVPADGSAAAEIAAQAPAARVVKAFNTTFAAHLTGGTVGSEPTTVLVAGDDGDARDAVASLVRDGGLDAVELGGLQRARELEAIGFVQVALAIAGTITWGGGFPLAR